MSRVTLSVARRFPLLVLAAVTAGAQPARDEDPVTELDRFIATETALADAGATLPTSRPVGSIYGSASILDLPRSATVLTPELMQQFDIQDFSDLSRIGAGTQTINYYGVPGVPILRGASGGVFFNGIQRAWQLNEMPLSFGSLEAMDVVRGPAPAHFGASQAGGYTNLLPKSPFFDRRRGSLMIELGQHNHGRAQVDLGGPVLIGTIPSAYRISLTGQKADSYYDDVSHDFISLYGAVKSRLADGVSLFTGAEFFRFNSNENAGWNRPTQALIDRGEYILGEPVALTSPQWNGTVVRTLIEFPFTYHLAPPFGSPLHALAIPGEIARTRIPDAQRALMIDMNDPAQVEQVYRALPASSIPGFASPHLQPVTAAALEQVTKATQDVYIYTPAYFAAGGEVLTEKISGSTVLADPRDFADSTNFLYFLDLEHTRNSSRSWKGQLLLDVISTTKSSTYGYATDTEQFVIEGKVYATEELEWLPRTTLTYGASARFTDAKILQDFFAEPFGRRDITRSDISANTLIIAGGQRGPSGTNFWSPTSQGGANAHSKLWQWNAFGYAQNRFGSRLSTFTSLLVAHAPYTTQYPEEVDLVPANDPRRERVRDHKNYGSFSFSPVLSVAPGVNLYGTYQKGTSLDALQGGAIVGKGNFARNELIEVGAKTELFDGRFFASAAAYQWEQTAFDERSNNAEPLEGEGIELEFTAQPSERWTVIGAVTWQEVQRLSPLVFRAPAYTEEEWALYGGVLAFQDAPGRPAANPDLIYPGFPQTQVKLFAIYTLPSGWGIAAGPIWSDAYWHNFDRTIRLPASLVWHANVFVRRRSWEARLTLENVTSEDYYLGAEPTFAANTLITKAPEFTAKLSVTRRF